jgi:hypothetical protein
LKKLGSWFVPYLMGLLIAIEGAALMVLSRRVEFVDVLALDQLMVMVLGAVFFILGMMLFVPVFPQWQGKVSEWALKKVQVGAAVVVLAISLIFLLIASPVLVEGYEEIGKQWVVLVEAQMFFLGILAFVYLYYEPLANRRLAWLEWLGMFASCLVITEGVVIFGLRGELNIHGVLRVGQEFMILIGVVLVALGLFEMVIFNRRREGRSEKALKMLDWAGMGMSLAIGAIGLIALIVATSMTLDGRTFGILWLLAAGLQLALLGSLLNYTQTLVGGHEGWSMDLGLITTIILLVAIPFAAAF